MREGLRVCARGVRRVLAHVGVLEGDEEVRVDRAKPIYAIPGPAGYVHAPADGVFEAFHELGAHVEAGVPAGAVHFLNDPERPPEIVRFAHAGMVYSLRAPGRVVRGNCVSVVVTGDVPD